MLMKKKIFTYTLKVTLLVLSLSLSIVSCEKNIIDVSENLTNETVEFIDKDYKVSVDEAKENLLEFLNAIESSSENGEISTRSRATRTIKNIEAVRNKSQNITTYSLNENSRDHVDTLMYLINFDNDEGFALVAADKRTSAIYALIDNGFLSADSMDKIDNPGFNIFLDNAKTKILTDIADFDVEKNEIEKSDGKFATYSIPIVDVKLKTIWGQRSPYDMYCPAGCPTGCVMTATAQILSYFQTVRSVQYYDKGITNSSSLNWTQIISDCNNNNGALDRTRTPQSAVQVAHLMRYLGLTFNASYSPSGTGAVSSTAVNWLKTAGGLSSTTNLYTFKCADVYPALMSDKLIYARANDVNTGGGHAWVIDGIVIYNFDSSRPPYYFLHCNWGWNGDCDGYYLNGAFDSDSYVNGNAQQGNGSIRYKFNHNVQMAIVGK